MKWTYAAAMLLAVLAMPSLQAAADDAGAQGGFDCSCEAKSGKGDIDNWNAAGKLDAKDAKKDDLKAQKADAGLHKPTSSADDSKDHMARDVSAKDAENRLEQFLNTADADHNGVFDSHERSTLVASMVECRLEHAQKMIKQFDTDKDGNLSAQERDAASKAIAAAFEKHMESMLKEFDTDGDGKLSDAERKAAREPDLVCNCQFKGDKSKLIDTSAGSSSDQSSPSSSDTGSKSSTY
jgi:Ca2+-binding EF-hand superfamily protein